MRRDMVNERVVCILLECILVSNCFGELKKTSMVPFPICFFYFSIAISGLFRWMFDNT